MFSFEMLVGFALAVALVALILARLSRAKPQEPSAPKHYDFSIGPKLPPRGGPMPLTQERINGDLESVALLRSSEYLKCMVDALVAAIGREEADWMLFSALVALPAELDQEGWSPQLWAREELRELGFLPPLFPPGRKE